MLLAGSFQFSIFLLFLFFSFPLSLRQFSPPGSAADSAARSGSRRHRPELPRAAAGTPRASCRSAGLGVGRPRGASPSGGLGGKVVPRGSKSGGKIHWKSSEKWKKVAEVLTPRSPGALSGERTGSVPEPPRAPRCPPPLTPTSLPGSKQTERARGDEAGGTESPRPFVTKIFGEIIAMWTREGNSC